MIIDIPDMVGGRFEGYTSPEANEKKILRNVFGPGRCLVVVGRLAAL